MAPENRKQPDTQRPLIRLLCVGKTYIDENKIGLVFHELDETGTPGTQRIYGQKNLKSVRVGALYEVEIDIGNPTVIYTNTMRWLRLWDNMKEAAVWQTAADAFDTRDLALKQEKRECSRKLVLELLAPIREEYWRTNALGKLAIEVRVLAYLRRVRTSED